MFGQKFKAAIKASGKNEKEVAKAIGLHFSNIYRNYQYESMDVMTLLKTAEYLQLPLSYFFADYDGSQKPAPLGTCERNELKAEVESLKQKLAAAQKEIIGLQDLIKINNYRNLQEKAKQQQMVLFPGQPAYPVPL